MGGLAGRHVRRERRGLRGGHRHPRRRTRREARRERRGHGQATAARPGGGGRPHAGYWRRTRPGPDAGHRVRHRGRQPRPRDRRPRAARRDRRGPPPAAVRCLEPGRPDDPGARHRRDGGGRGTPGVGHRGGDRHIRSGTAMTDTTTALEPLVARLSETAPGLRVETGPGSTGPYAYDASNYRVPPRAVVFPRSADDVVAVVRACRETGVPVTARGGGTSMAGNAVGPGLVLDFSRYMNRILDIDPVARTARVEAGVILDALRSATALYGLTFGPDPSSHSRCTL